MSSLSFGARVLGCVALLFAVERCSSSSSHPPGGATTSTVIGTTGGSVASSDGVLSVNIPAGALPANVTVTVTPESSPPSGAIGAVYDIGPEGTVFASPVTMTFHYGSVSLGSTTASNLRAATYGSGSWQILASAAQNASAQTVSGTTMHLSPYGIVAASTGAACAPVSIV
jgi:hypothetical protein